MNVHSNIARRILTKRSLRQFTTSQNIVAIQSEFKKQSKWFEDGWSNKSNTSTTDLMTYVQESISNVQPIQSTDVALDVATGTGIFARNLVHAGCNKVYGLDATSEMLEQAKTKAQEENIAETTLELIQGDAAKLPFPNDYFDLVTSRLAIHHFSDPIESVTEMARVCKPGGRVIVVDIVSSSDDSEAQEMNRLETLRDPTHVWAFQINQLQELMKECGLAFVNEKDDASSDASVHPTFQNSMNLAGWMKATETNQSAQLQIERSIEIEIFENGTKTGMNPFMVRGELSFMHNYVTLQARKV